MTLVRSRGLPVQGRTVDLGRGGMRMLSARPLRIDDVLAFTVDLPGGEVVSGRARVLREDLPRTYGLRFEALDADGAATLARVVGSAGPVPVPG